MAAKTLRMGLCRRATATDDVRFRMLNDAEPRLFAFARGQRGDASFDRRMLIWLRGQRDDHDTAWLRPRRDETINDAPIPASDAGLTRRRKSPENTSSSRLCPLLPRPEGAAPMTLLQRAI